MFNFRIPLRGQVSLTVTIARLMLSIVLLIGPLALGSVRSSTASAAGGPGRIYIPFIESGNQAVTPPPSGPLPVGQAGTWHLIFRDEFNGTSLDSSKWSAAWDSITGIYGPVNTAETACYDSSNIVLPGDGSLHLQLESKQATCKGASRPYSGALIHSNAKYQFTYGYYEVRAFLPAASNGAIANWPAAWNNGQSWPADGENDTMEGLSGKACYHFHYAVDSNTAGDTGACANGSFTGWHIFASDWEPGSVTYYYDGVQVGQITSGITSSPHYLILDYTQGSWGGPASVPAEMQIDYVRVWQH